MEWPAHPPLERGGGVSPRRFFHGPMVVNGMRVPLDMTDSKRKRKYIEKICLYNCFTHCI